jgi:hypothetical protein
MKTPWHLWLVGIVALLWNSAGAYTIMLAQAGKLPGLSDDEVAYYAAQPVWFVIVTDIALLAAIVAAMMLLLRLRLAVALFAISLAAIAITDGYDLIAGSARMLTSTGALVVTILIFCLGVLELAYAAAMKKRSILR